MQESLRKEGFKFTWILGIILDQMFQVALKSLIVIHRVLREGDPTFKEELLHFSHRGHIFQISNFKDESSPLGELNVLTFSCVCFVVFMFILICRCVSSIHILLSYTLLFMTAWDCSAWVRTYGLFLEERLECFRNLKYDIEGERYTKTSPGINKVSFSSTFVGFMPNS